MARGKRPIIDFRDSEYRIADMATVANNMGIKTVESLKSGIYYFFEDDEVVIATKRGSAKMKLSTAEMIVAELTDMINEYRADQRAGLKPMDSRKIQKMLQEDFT